MTLSTINSYLRKILGGLGNEPYLFINTVFAAVIVMVFVYSLVFSPTANNYPVVCVHEKLTGQPCFSCGLSHSFSLIVRGQFREALLWNPYGMRVFLFFLLQLTMRFLFSYLYIRRKAMPATLIALDASVSVLLFLFVFFPFLRYLVLAALA